MAKTLAQKKADGDPIHSKYAAKKRRQAQGRRISVAGSVLLDEAIANAVVMIRFGGGWTIFTKEGRLDVDNEEAPSVACWVIDVRGVVDTLSGEISKAMRAFIRSPRDEDDVNWLSADLLRLGAMVKKANHDPANAGGAGVHEGTQRKAKASEDEINAAWDEALEIDKALIEQAWDDKRIYFEKPQPWPLPGDEKVGA